MPFCHVTAAIEGEKDGDLLERKGGEGFPHIVFMDAEGIVVAVHDGPRTPEGFARTGAAAKAFVALRGKAATGDPVAKGDLLVQQVKLGHVSADAAEKQAVGMTLTAEQKAALGVATTDVRVLEIARTIRSDETERQAAKTFLAMHKAGKPGPSREDTMQTYWILLMSAAEEAKDAEAFETGLKTLKAKFAEEPDAQAFFKKQEETLRRLTSEKK